MILLVYGKGYFSILRLYVPPEMTTDKRSIQLFIRTIHSLTRNAWNFYFIKQSPVNQYFYFFTLNSCNVLGNLL